MVLCVIVQKLVLPMLLCPVQSFRMVLHVFVQTVNILSILPFSIPFWQTASATNTAFLNVLAEWFFV